MIFEIIFKLNIFNNFILGPSGFQASSLNLPSVVPKAETITSNQETAVDELFSPSSPTPKQISNPFTEQPDTDKERLSVDERRISIDEGLSLIHI